MPDKIKEASEEFMEDLFESLSQDPIYYFECVGGKGACGSKGGGYSAKSVNNGLELVERLVISGGPNKFVSDFKDEKALDFLKQTVKGDELDLYRGMGIVKHRAREMYTKSEIEILNNLKPGDKLPNFLSKRYNNLTSYTKKESVAKYYAKEGNVKILFKAKVGKKNIVADLENLEKVIASKGIKQKIFGKEDFKYFKKDKEVIVREPIDATIVSISGKIGL